MSGARFAARFNLWWIFLRENGGDYLVELASRQVRAGTLAGPAEGRELARMYSFSPAAPGCQHFFPHCSEIEFARRARRSIFGVPAGDTRSPRR